MILPDAVLRVSEECPGSLPEAGWQGHAHEADHAAETGNPNEKIVWKATSCMYARVSGFE
jgi:hypothetical protein